MTWVCCVLGVVWCAAALRLSEDDEIQQDDMADPGYLGNIATDHRVGTPTFSRVLEKFEKSMQWTSFVHNVNGGEVFVTDALVAGRVLETNADNENAKAIDFPPQVSNTSHDEFRNESLPTFGNQSSKLPVLDNNSIGHRFLLSLSQTELSYGFNVPLPSGIRELTTLTPWAEIFLICVPIVLVALGFYCWCSRGSTVSSPGGSSSSTEPWTNFVAPIGYVRKFKTLRDPSAHRKTPPSNPASTVSFDSCESMNSSSANICTLNETK